MLAHSFLNTPELARVIDPKANVTKKPITPDEEFFVNTVVSHTSSVYEALEDELVTQDFAAFIDSSLK